jgi:FkbM family methyltransferase
MEGSRNAGRALLVKGPRPGAAARRAFFDEAALRTPYVAVEVNGLTFFVATNDRLGRQLFVRGWRQDIGHLTRAVNILREHGAYRAGSTFVDVGAHIGTTSVEAVRRQGFARGVALEPAPDNFRMLRVNLAANEVDSVVTALQAAVSDREGEVELVLNARSSGAHTLLPLLPDRAGAILGVQAVRLDDLVRRKVIEPDLVGLLWADAAGAEGFVLAGASALLERCVPIVTALRPALPSWPQTKKTLIQLLSRYTGFVNLRRGKDPPVDTLEPLLDSLTGDGDLLAFRR